MRNILKTAIIIIINALSNMDMAAQVIKKTVTEHFTNSNCSVCASNNPGFYATLDKYPDVLHIAFYPSSPYPNCYFSQQNPLENDARTKFYGLYGSTPRFTVNGMVTSLSSVDARLNSESSATANFDIRSKQTQLAYDSIKVEIVIKKLATDTMKLEEGDNISIIEINGALSEPAHIYDPKHSFFWGVSEIISHQKMMFEISRENKKTGHSNIGIIKGIKEIRIHFKEISRLKKTGS